MAGKKLGTGLLPMAIYVAGWLLLFNATGCQSLNVNQGLQKRLHPSNVRDWKPEQATAPLAQINGTACSLHNIRNCSYLSVDDYVVDYYDRTIDLSQIQSVDFIMVPFGKTHALAHTMLSFGLDDGTYLGVSVEVRKEKGEEYNVLSGLARKFEVMYVLGEERDLIRLRTKFYENDVYVFPTVATATQSQRLFVDIAGRMNQLADEPEFYNSISNNCTTNLKDHVNKLSPERIKSAWQVLLPGFSAKYAYDIGLLDNRIPFEDLESVAYVNALAEEHFDDPQFSQMIRLSRERIERYAQRQQRREPTLRPE